MFHKIIHNIFINSNSIFITYKKNPKKNKTYKKKNPKKNKTYKNSLNKFIINK